MSIQNFQSKEIIFLNGKFLKASQARLSVLEPGFLYGWGLFETMRAYNGKIVYFEQHLQRIKNSCRLLGMVFPHSLVSIKKIIKKTVAKNGFRDVYTRLTLWKCEKGTDILVTVRKYKPYSIGKYRKGFCTCVSSFRQNDNFYLSRLKTTNYLLYRLALREAEKKGFDEALILNQKGYIAEASRSNLFLIKDKEIFTPSLECGCLNGITRRVVLDLAKKNNMKVYEGNFTIENLLAADGAFLTNSLMGIMPLTSLEKIAIGKNKCLGLIKFFIKKYNSLFR
ncbi:MAG: aminotransferase class IV [Candidatus Omnitrophica bacterium]|nr:aminotransferase class IV [Candidatus Omnitrophota bacterium]